MSAPPGDPRTTSGANEEAPPLRVVIAEPHSAMRSALETMLSQQAGILVVAVAADLAEAGAASRRLAGDALVVDAGLLHGSRLELGPLSSATRLVAVGMERHACAAERAQAAGALAYVVKDQAHVLLADALLALRR